MAPFKKLATIKDAKIVKHTPPLMFKFSNKDKFFRVKTSSPFMSCVKQIQKKLSKIEDNIKLSDKRNRGNNTIKNKFVTVVGLQRVIGKVLLLANYFQQRGHKIDIRTITVNALDEFMMKEHKEEENDDRITNDVEESDEDDSIMRKRKISGLEIDIFI